MVKKIWLTTNTRFRHGIINLSCTILFIILSSCQGNVVTQYPRFGDPLGDNLSMVCSNCQTWEEVELYYGEDFTYYLKFPKTTWGSIFLAGDMTGKKGEFVLIPDQRCDTSKEACMFVWDLTNNQETSYKSIIAYSIFTVWSPDSNKPDSQYLYTGLQSAAIGFSSKDAELWAMPSILTVKELIQRIPPSLRND